MTAGVGEPITKPADFLRLLESQLVRNFAVNRFHTDPSFGDATSDRLRQSCRISISGGIKQRRCILSCLLLTPLPVAWVSSSKP